MSRLSNYIPIGLTTFTPTATITAGQPVSPAGAVAAADTHIIGIAIEDTGIAATDDKLSTALWSGEADVVANGAITAGDYIKVGASGKFLSADATALAAGKVVGKAKTAASGDGKTFTAFFSGF